MTALPLDTLKLACSLREKAKLSADQAEGFADAIAEAVQSDLATKGDVGDVRSKLRDLRTDVEKLAPRSKAEIEAGKAETIKWMSGTIGFQSLVIVGAVIALTRVVRP